MCARFLLLTAAMISCLSILSGCGVLREKQNQSDPNLEIAKEAVKTPLSPEETEEMLGDVASNWFYGQGIGETMLTVGTIVVFPPYAIYVAGNAALSLAGYEEIRVSEALPDTGEDVWNSVYDGVTSVPGRVTSTVANTEYVTKRTAENTLSKYIKRGKAPEQNSAEDSIKTWR